MGRINIQEITAPTDTPASGYSFLFVDSATGFLSNKKSDGTTNAYLISVNLTLELARSNNDTMSGIALYAADYSGSYTDRSLVDKAYVDSAVSGENFWDKTGTTVTLATDTDNVSLGDLTTADEQLVLKKAGANTFIKLITDDNNAYDAGIKFIRESTEYYRIYMDNTTANFFIATGTTPTNRIAIDQSGNVGIGTESPSNPLHLYDNTGILLEDSGTGSTPLQIKNTGGTLSLSVSGTGKGVIEGVSNNNVLIQNSSGTCIELESTGELTIDSTNTTTDNFVVSNDALTTGSLARFYSNSADTSNRNLIEIINDNLSSSGTDLIYLQQDGSGNALSANADIVTTADVYADSIEVNNINLSGALFQEVFGDRTGEVLNISFTGIGEVNQYDKGPLNNTAVASSASMVESDTGVYSSGCSFNGTTDTLTITSPKDFPTGANVRTFECTFKSTDITVIVATLFSYGENVGTNRFAVQQVNDTIRIYSLSDSVSSGSVVSINTWYKLQVVYNGTHIDAYLNGQKIIDNQALTVTTASDTNAYIGSLDGTQDYFKGWIDNVRFYDRALAEDELKAPYLRSVKSTRGGQASKPDNVYEIWSVNDLPDAAGGVITLPSGMYYFMSDITLSDRIELAEDADVQWVMPNSYGNCLTYTGSSNTFITGNGTNSFRILFPGAQIHLTGNSVKFIDVFGSVGIQFSYIEFSGTDGALGDVVGGSSGAVTASRFFWTRTSCDGWKTGWNISNTDRLYCDIGTINSASNANTGFFVLDNIQSFVTISRLDFTMNSANAAIMDIRPTNENEMNIERCDLKDGTGSFFKSGTTGTFTAVADASIGATTITSVTDSSGTARFNYTGSSVYVNQEVVISGFTTNTDYNGTYLVTTTGSIYFEIEGISFGSNEIGSFLSNSVTLTDTGTSVSDGDSILIDTDLSTDYDGGSYVYNKQTNSFQINATWTATATGDWDSGSLTEDSKYVTADNNGDQLNSKSALFAYVNTNVTTTTFAAIDTWYDLELGTVLEGTETSRFKYVGNNTFEVTTLNPIKGVFEADISTIKTVGAKDYDFRMYVTSGTGSFDGVIKTYSVDTNISSFTVKASGTLQPGDQFQVQVRTGTTTTNSTMTATGFTGEFK